VAPREAPAAHFQLLLIALLSGIARPMDGFKNRRLEKSRSGNLEKTP
jgi:hypothetical protein